MAAKIHWRTLIAALGIGLVVELWELIRLTQQPGLGLVQSWVGVVRPGYAELMGDMFLVPVIQWLVYAAVIYLILELYLRKSSGSTRESKV